MKKIKSFNELKDFADKLKPILHMRKNYPFRGLLYLLYNFIFCPHCNLINVNFKQIYQLAM